MATCELWQGSLPLSPHVMVPQVSKVLIPHLTRPGFTGAQVGLEPGFGSLIAGRGALSRNCQG